MSLERFGCEKIGEDVIDRRNNLSKDRDRKRERMKQ